MQSVLTITLAADGQVRFQATGPASENKVTMFGLLEIAKQAVLGATAEPPKPPAPSILVARGSLPANGR